MMSDYCLYPNQCGIGMDCSECYQKHIADLEKRLAAAEADTKRLEWLVQNQAGIEVHTHDDCVNTVWISGESIHHIHLGSDWREAIDTARREGE